MAAKKEPETIPEEPIETQIIEEEIAPEETEHRTKSAPQFNWKKYVIKVQGGREYLTAAARLRWFRDEHPDWSISTEIFSIDANGVLIKATVTDDMGFVIATGFKQVFKNKDAENYISKAETGAVNRALTFCGYGLPAEEEMSEDLSMAQPQSQPQDTRYRSHADPNQPSRPTRPGWPG